MRNTLLSAVSHDLRTPITAIAGLAGTLEKKLADPAQLRNWRTPSMVRQRR